MAVTVSILGSTGSVGQQTLSIISEHRDQFEVLALSAHRQVDLLFKQCELFHPKYVVCVDSISAQTLRSRLAAVGSQIEVLEGKDALVSLAADSSVEVVVAAIVGAAGLPATFAAVRAGKTVLLANKESLVMSGALFMDAVQQYGARLLPVDSEHNALFQCLPMGYLPGQGQPVGVDEIILTASGGPFLKRSLDTFLSITPQEAVAHPKWSMGAKISVDSATMMNKGLEVIEAHWLFGFPHHQINVVIHPQSTVHGFLRYSDGSLLAQCGMPDMRTPISYCLGWPRRLSVNVARLELTKIGQFDFFEPDYDRFPCLRYAYQALESGLVAMIVLNAANEIAVSAFLNEQLNYVDIPNVVEAALSQIDFATPKTIDAVLDIDHQARRVAVDFCARIANLTEG